MLNTKLKTIFSCVLLGGAVSLATPVYAANDAMMDLLKILRDKGSISAEEYELLANASKADKEKVEGVANELNAKVDKATKKLPKIKTDGKFSVASQDGDWEFRPIGRVFWDYVAINRDEGAIGTYGDSGAELRRARLGMQGKIKPFSWKFEMDWADTSAGGLSWKDVWLAYNGKNDFGKYWIKFGQAHTAFGHTTISSSKYMPMIRRPLFAGGPQHERRVGVSAYQEGSNWFVHGSAQVPPLNDNIVGGQAVGEDRKTYAVRIGGTPYKKDKNHLFHIGGSYQYEDLQGDTFNNLDNNLVSHLGDGDQLEWDSAEAGLTVEEVNAFSGEAISVWGPLHGAFEYVAWDIDTATAGSFDVNGWAFDVGYFLTGESMNYKTKGHFSGTKPKNSVTNGGIGAWQVVARYEQFDLRDSTVDGGEAELITIGLNWLPTKNTRIMANYINTLSYDCGDGTRTGTALPGTTRTCDGNTGEEPSSFTIRAQMYF